MRSYLFTYARFKSGTGYLLPISSPGWILFIETNHWLKGYPLYLYIEYREIVLSSCSKRPKLANIVCCFSMYLKPSRAILYKGN